MGPASKSTDRNEQEALVGTFRGRACLVTGHTGFKGSWLGLWLHALGARVTGYALDPPTQPSLFDEARIGELVDDHRGDVRDAERLAKLIGRVEPEVIFHLAAQAVVRESYRRPKETFDVNVGGTVNVLEAARTCPSVRAVVVVTSDKCYENREWVHAYRETDRLGGRDPYSASKAAAELVAIAYRRSLLGPSGIAVATARAGNVIGGGDWAADRIVPDAVRALMQGQAIPVRSPDSVRPWQHVLDPLRGYLTLAARLMTEAGLDVSLMQHAEAWNFGPSLDGCRTVRELVELLLAEWGGGKWQDHSTSQMQRPHEAGLLMLSCAKAYRHLGWRTRWAFAEAVGHTARWYRRWLEDGPARNLCLEQIAEYMAAAPPSGHPLPDGCVPGRRADGESQVEHECDRVATA
ncbi:MAG TPA: CDP-glucose 4,6-dehydratase [Phycisphaerae bacterium]|nr:CDP-glucose 4,6-dehydratase [Phycisphaerae bacterium]